MPRRPKDVTDAELALLKVLWELPEHGPGATVRELAERLYPEASASDVATVQTLLTRLDGKGFVGRLPGVSPAQYRAAIDRAGLIDRRLRETAEALCEGSMAPLLTRLVETASLSEAERARLLALIDGLDAGDEARR